MDLLSEMIKELHSDTRSEFWSSSNSNMNWMILTTSDSNANKSMHNTVRTFYNFRECAVSKIKLVSGEIKKNNNT